MFRKKTTLPKQTSTNPSYDAFEFSPGKSKLSSPSPKRKKAATTRKMKTPTKQKTPTKTTPKQSMFKSFLKNRTTLQKPGDESFKRIVDEKFDEARKWQPLPTIFERKEANTLLNSIRNKQDVGKTISTISDMGP